MGTLHAENHGRKVYRKIPEGNTALDVLIYFWDERDGPNFCGWWFGPKVGGDQVWAYSSDKGMTPPLSQWRVPYDGPVDPSIVLTMEPHGGGAAPQPPQQQQQPQQHQQHQQHQQQHQQQGNQQWSNQSWQQQGQQDWYAQE